MHIAKIIKQKNAEVIHLKLRRHMFALLPGFIVFVTMHGCAFGMYYLMVNNYASAYQTDIGKTLTITLTASLLMSAWLLMYGLFIDYYLDLWVVTNTRIINIEQLGLFARVISETDLYKVQDVTSEIEGFFPTVLDFGYVHIQSAGEIGRFNFEQIPEPHQVRKKIIQLVQVDRKRHAKESLTPQTQM